MALQELQRMFDVSGTVWQGIIHLSLNDLSGNNTLQSLQDYCESFAVCQHEPDDKVPRIHCHLLIHNPSVKQNQLQKTYKALNPSLGRGDHMIMTLTQEEPRKPYNRFLLLRYMIKGVHAVHFVKNISTEEVEAARASWNSVVVREPRVSLKDSQVKTHYEVMTDIIADAKSKNGIYSYELVADYEGNLDMNWVIKDHDRLWDVMLRHLDLNHVRTSIHELERFYVTMTRGDLKVRNKYKDNIFSKIFSKH